MARRLMVGAFNNIISHTFCFYKQKQIKISGNKSNIIRFSPEANSEGCVAVDGAFVVGPDWW